MRVRLKPTEAESLGLEVRLNEGTRNARYTISSEQFEKIKDFRLGSLKTQTEKDNIPLNDTKHLWLKTPEASYFITNPLYKKDEENSLFDRFKDIINSKECKYPKIKRTPSKDAHLLVVNPADIHIGKLTSAFETGDEYNVKIAVKRVKDGVQGILDKSSGFNIDKILFVAGNDILHTDNAKRQTTSGTPQDTDGMWYENFLSAFKLYVELIETLVSVADVHFVFCPSNHDYMSGFFLCQTVEQYFRNNKNITFDCSMSHRKYYVYGENLLGFTHGDSAKQADLPLLMAHEAKEWSITKHRYIFCHHVHHRNSKDFMSVNVETMRSPSGTDSWHHRSGYQHAPKAVEGFLHHKSFGQVAKLSHLF